MCGEGGDGFCVWEEGEGVVSSIFSCSFWLWLGAGKGGMWADWWVVGSRGVILAWWRAVLGISPVGWILGRGW